MQAPKDSLVRARTETLGLRAADDSTKMPTLHGYFTPFDEWSEIDSAYEGHFMERTVKGAFTRTIKNNRDSIKVLFNHGHDVVGEQVLGPIKTLREDDQGPFYEVPLLDTSYNRDLIPGLEAGLYGASYRFRVIKEEWNDAPERSDHNPNAIPERTITENQLYEFGPVTFPAFEGASAGVRSLTDDYMIERLLSNPVALARLVERVPEFRTAGEPALSTSPVVENTPDPLAHSGSHGEKRNRDLALRFLSQIG